MGCGAAVASARYTPSTPEVAMAKAFAGELKHSDPQVRRGACWGLGRLPPSHVVSQAAELLKCLADQDEQVVTAANEALHQLLVKNQEQLQSEGNTIAARVLSKQLSHPSPKVRRGACWSLSCLSGEAAAPYVGALTRCLGDSNPSVVAAAEQALSTLTSCKYLS